MDAAHSRQPSAWNTPLTLRAGVAIVLVQWLARFGLPIVAPEAMPVGVMAGMGGGVAVAVWWTFFSRAPWAERLGALGLMIAALLGAPLLLHESVATGAMGGLFFILAIPTLSLAFVMWAAVSRRLAPVPRYAALVAAVAIGCGGWSLVRTGGFTGSFDNDLQWRWTATPEDRLLARAEAALPIVPGTPQPVEEPPAAAEADAGAVVPEPAPPAMRVSVPVPRVEWPGFRGPQRNGIVADVRIETDWSAWAPTALWRRAVGPGWSSFAVSGDLFYTQEQRGDHEIVTAYRISTGDPVWIHRDAARFWESNGGAGPRGTPTVSRGRVYAMGATGILNALDAGSGALVWLRNVESDTDTPVPMWGFAGSPLVVDDVVVVAASGTLAAYDLATGASRWDGPRHSGEGYSSPQLATIDGVPQVLLLSADGATSVAPADGTVLWEHSWPAVAGPIVQPAVTEDGDVLIATLVGMTGGAVRRLAVTHEQGAWVASERWTTTRLKPYFNDFVVHEGHAYGFDGSILACIDLADGARTWKGGRYGNGQLVLLPDQDLLLIVSEEGELALVSATPDEFRPIAQVPGIEGKTWNHPVLVGDVLLVRNGEEMAAFRLSPAP